MTQPDESVRHEKGGERGRFALTVGDSEAELTYVLRDGVMVVNHTFTPPAMRGHGVASRLMRQAVAYAQEAGMTISPLCPYADAWMRRHPEHADLLAG